MALSKKPCHILRLRLETCEPFGTLLFAAFGSTSHTDHGHISQSRTIAFTVWRGLQRPTSRPASSRRCDAMQYRYVFAQDARLLLYQIPLIWKFTTASHAGYFSYRLHQKHFSPSLGFLSGWTGKVSDQWNGIVIRIGISFWTKYH